MFNVEITVLAYHFLLLDQHAMKNTNNHYRGFAFRKYNLRNLILAFLGKELADKIVQLALRKQQELCIALVTIKNEVESNYVNFCREQVELLALLMKISGMSYASISASMNVLGCPLGTRQNVELILNSVNILKLVDIAEDPNSCYKQITPPNKRLSISDFIDTIYACAGIAIFARLVLYIEKCNVTFEDIHAKFQTLDSNCKSKESRKGKALKEGKPLAYLSIQDRSLVRNKVAKRLVSPYEFIIALISATIHSDEQHLASTLALVSSRFEDKGHYQIRNFTFTTRSMNSSYARLLEKLEDSEETGHPLSDVNAKELQRIRFEHKLAFAEQKSQLTNKNKLQNDLDALMMLLDEEVLFPPID